MKFDQIKDESEERFKRLKRYLKDQRLMHVVKILSEADAQLLKSLGGKPNKLSVEDSPAFCVFRNITLNIGLTFKISRELWDSSESACYRIYKMGRRHSH